MAELKESQKLVHFVMSPSKDRMVSFGSLTCGVVAVGKVWACVELEAETIGAGRTGGASASSMVCREV